MPSKIWLHKDTKYSTGDIVCGYQYDFVQGIEDEGGIENFVKYVPADAFIERALAYLHNKFYFNNVFYGIVSTDFNAMEEMYEDFRKYMEGE